MSFDYNPFKHIEVVHEPHGNYKLYCHSCGTIWGDYVSTVPVNILFDAVAKHILDSHKRSRESFDSYSTV